MRTIAHLSDLHFGRIERATLQPLLKIICALQPDLVAISGDLTQRAREKQFQHARAFIDALPFPKIVVPGNHDIPLYNPVLRFARPLSRFMRYVTSDLAPSFIDSEIAVVGVNTTRSLVRKGGRVNREQVADAYEKFYCLKGEPIKILVTHHPFDLPPGFSETDLVGRSRMAMENFARCGVDVFLAGHLHHTHTGNTARYEIAGFSALVIQAGTATSIRRRGEMNSFNLVRIASPQITVENYVWQPDQEIFAALRAKRFTRSSQGWMEIHC